MDTGFCIYCSTNISKDYKNHIARCNKAKLEKELDVQGLVLVKGFKDILSQTGIKIKHIKISEPGKSFVNGLWVPKNIASIIKIWSKNFNKNSKNLLFLHIILHMCAQNENLIDPCSGLLGFGDRNLVIKYINSFQTLCCTRATAKWHHFIKMKDAI